MLVFGRRGLHVHLAAKLAPVHRPAQIDCAAVHARADVLPGHWRGLAAQPQHHEYAPGHVFAEEVLGRAARDDDRHLVAEGLHVYAYAVAHVAAQEDPAPAHGVADHVAPVAVHHHLARVHGVAHGRLCAAANDHLRPVHERGRVGAGHSLHLDLHLRPQSAADVPLAVHVLEHQVLFARGHGLAHQAVQPGEVHAFRVDPLHIVATRASRSWRNCLGSEM